MKEKVLFDKYMDAKNRQLMLVELYSGAGAQLPVSSMHLSVRISKEGSTSHSLCHNYGICVCIILKSD